MQSLPTSHPTFSCVSWCPKVLVYNAAAFIQYLISGHEEKPKLPSLIRFAFSTVYFSFLLMHAQRNNTKCQILLNTNAYASRLIPIHLIPSSVVIWWIGDSTVDTTHTTKFATSLHHFPLQPGCISCISSEHVNLSHLLDLVYHNPNNSISGR